ncbi:MAG: hypothetical protein ACLR0U_09790 [Enterocloster clostridioformis]
MLRPDHSSGLDSDAEEERHVAMTVGQEQPIMQLSRHRKKQ